MWNLGNNLLELRSFVSVVKWETHKMQHIYDNVWYIYVLWSFRNVTHLYDNAWYIFS